MIYGKKKNAGLKTFFEMKEGLGYKAFVELQRKNHSKCCRKKLRCIFF